MTYCITIINETNENKSYKIYSSKCIDDFKFNNDFETIKDIFEKVIIENNWKTSDKIYTKCYHSDDIIYYDNSEYIELINLIKNSNEEDSIKKLIDKDTMADYNLFELIKLCINSNKYSIIEYLIDKYGKNYKYESSKFIILIL